MQHQRNTSPKHSRVMSKQLHVRIYPDNWFMSDRKNEENQTKLNSLFSKGYTVAHVVKVSEDSKGRIINDFILNTNE